MIFLQHIARDIISGIITVDMQRESRSWFRRTILSKIFIDGIPMFLFPMVQTITLIYFFRK